MLEPIFSRNLRAKGDSRRVAGTSDQVAGRGRVRVACRGRGVSSHCRRDSLSEGEDVGHGSGDERRESGQLTAEEETAIERSGGLFLERSLNDVRGGDVRGLGRGALAELGQKSRLEPSRRSLNLRAKFCMKNICDILQDLSGLETVELNAAVIARHADENVVRVEVALPTASGRGGNGDGQTLGRGSRG